MSITNDGNVVTVFLSDGTKALTIDASKNWNATLSGQAFTDSDGSLKQWDIPSQSFQPVTGG